MNDLTLLQQDAPMTLQTLYFPPRLERHPGLSAARPRLTLAMWEEVFAQSVLRLLECFEVGRRVRRS